MGQPRHDRGSPPRLRTDYVKVNGLRFHYREWGDRGSPDLVLVHGWATASVLWIDVAEALSDRFHIVAPDNRGNGESDAPDKGYELSDYASDIIGIIGELELRRPHFVGNSWGANIGTYIAAQHPDIISRAVLEDPVYWKMVDAFATVVPGLLARRERPEGELRAEALARGLSSEQADRELYLATHFAPHALTQVSTVNRGWAVECDDFLARIGVPTLVLVADENAGGYVSDAELEHHRRTASSEVEFRQWHGVGHLMHAEQPERFVREVRDFLD